MKTLGLGLCALMVFACSGEPNESQPVEMGEVSPAIPQSTDGQTEADSTAASEALAGGDDATADQDDTRDPAGGANAPAADADDTSSTEGSTGNAVEGAPDDEGSPASTGDATDPAEEQGADESASEGQQTAEQSADESASEGQQTAEQSADERDLEQGEEGAAEETAPSIELSTELLERLDAAAQLDANSFAESTAVAFEELGYDPSESIGLDLIQDSELGLTEQELAKFNENGFVISTRAEFPNFSYGYASIYGDDLPVFISADSILYALHTAYDDILKALESYALIGETRSTLDGLRTNLAASGLSGDVHTDLDVYLTVADGLLAGEMVVPEDSANADLVETLYDGCNGGSGMQTVELFGSAREVDFSQCTPRGHYTDSQALMRYFRAMMWLGRIDFRLLEGESELVLNRRQAEAAIALRTLMDEAIQTSHGVVDAVVTAFVGDHDYMTPAQIDQLMADLDVSSMAELAGVTDETLKSAIVRGNYGVQRISSHILNGNAGIGESRPLPQSFALFGQRYVIDSHVFSSVVYDRVKDGEVARMMPDPLDAAHAALRNDQAGMLLAPELEAYDYASELATMRTVVEAEPQEFWDANLYNRWLGALQTLSPVEAMTEGEGESLPQIAKTEAWGRRLLNTQMASWAELRHDTILYAKQSYTSAGQCEFPDAYVDPYPQFFDAIAALAEHALAVIDEQGIELVEPELTGGFTIEDSEALTAYRAMQEAGPVLEKFVEVNRTLSEMATHQRTGAAHSEEHIEFVNRAVSIGGGGCGGPPYATGWYGELFLSGSMQWAPTIADVHTQPTTIGGAPVGNVLHVGTGNARMMVVSVDTCSGPRAYAGLASSYYERIESDFNRLTDPDWEDILESDELPESPQWVSPLLAE